MGRLRRLGFLRWSRNPAPVEVAGIVPGVLVEIPLVVFLGAPELGVRNDLGDDLAIEVLLRLIPRLDRRLLLLGVVVEDGRAVLESHVWALAVERRRVVDVPELVEQLLV